MFISRKHRGTAWLRARIALFLVGAFLALLGMALDDDWIIGAAIVVLACGVLIRFIPHRTEDGGDAPAE